MPRSNELKKVTDLFEKYRKHLKPPQKTVVKEFVEVVSDVMGIDVPVEKIEYSTFNKTIFLKVSGMIKSEIKLKESELLAHTKARLGTNDAPQKIL